MTGDWLLLSIALILAVLLVVGLVQAFRVPRRSSRRIRPRGARRQSQRTPRRVPDAIARAVPPRAEQPSPIALLPPHEVVLPLAETEVVLTGVVPQAEDPSPVVVPASAFPAPPEESPSAPEGSAHLLEECQRFFETKRYQELLLLATPYLQQAGTASDAAFAELWSLVGRSREALNDEHGARAAFEEAIRCAPESDLAAHLRHLAVLAAVVGHRLISRVEHAPDTTPGEERIATLRQAAVWLKQGVLAVPENDYLASLLARAHRGLWASYGGAATALLRRREFHGARRLLREALSDADFPADRREAMRELLATTFTGEIGQLTAHALQSLDGGREQAAVLLQRAENILASIPVETIAQAELLEANRRVWWGYTKLGLRRMEAGEFKEALEPLFRALRIDEVDPERRAETRAALVQALDHVIRDGASRIDQLLDEGKLEPAAREGEWLRAVAEEGRQLGLREEDLAASLAVARPIMARLERARSGTSP